MMSSCCLTILVLILSINYWAADGYPACSHTLQDLGECMTEEVCKVSGGVIGSDRDNNRCQNDVQANNGGEGKVYCTTFKHLAKDLCSTWMPLWEKHDEKCNMSLTWKIAGGENATKGEFKHLAAVGKWMGTYIGWECGGTLISPHYVLTAAHCVNAVDEFYVKLGEYNFKDTALNSTNGIKMVLPGYLHRFSEYNEITDYTTVVKQQFKVKRVISHPKFHTSRKKYDIALLELPTPVVLNKDVLPACLPFGEDELDVGTILTASGWGATRSGGDPVSVVRKVNIPVVDSETTCQEMYPNHDITPDVLCAGARGSDTCQGDSGGPVGKAVSREDYPCGAQVFGIVSYGYQCNYIGIYTRVTFYLDWIMRYLAPDHYLQHITERIHSTGLEFDGNSKIHFKINDDIFTNGFRIQLYFKTEDRSGVLLTIPRQESSLVLRLKNGQVRFREPLGNVTIVTENSYNDGEWHYLTVECRPSIDSCYLKIASQIANENLKQAWTPPLTLEGDRVQTLIMGGKETHNNFYQGCLAYSLSSSLRLRIAQSYHGTVLNCNSNKPEEHLEDYQDVADHDLLHLEHLWMEEKITFMEDLLQDMSSKMNDIQNVKLLPSDSSISTSKNTGCYPPFVSLSSTAECLFFGKVPLTLYEANTTCQIMGAKLATPNDLAELKTYMHTHKLEVGHWVDGNDMKNGNGIFTWSSGEVVHEDCFDTGFPKTTNNGNSCLQYNPSWEGYRNAHSCSEDIKSRYICKNTDVGTVNRAEPPKCIKSISRK